MITAFQNLQTREVDHFVLCMNICMERNVVLGIAMSKRLQAHKHVKDIKYNGINMFKVIVGKHLPEQEGYCKGKMNIYLGSLQYKQINSPMTSLLLIFRETIILLQITSTVLKPYVPHVVLLLHGQSLQKQSHQQIY